MHNKFISPLDLKIKQLIKKLWKLSDNYINDKIKWEN